MIVCDSIRNICEYYWRLSIEKMIVFGARFGGDDRDRDRGGNGWSQTGGFKRGLIDWARFPTSSERIQENLTDVRCRR